jgi:hypothetical protein
MSASLPAAKSVVFAAGHVFVESVYESSCVREEDLQELQDRAPSSRRVRDLRGRAAQAASGLIATSSFKTLSYRVF